MRKRLLISSFFAILTASLIVQIGIGESPQKVKSISEVQEVGEHTDHWKLKGKDKHELSKQIVSWVNDHFRSSRNDLFGDVTDVDTPLPPFKLVHRIEFEVVPIAEMETRCPWI